jgi:hypothetical protein
MRPDAEELRDRFDYDPDTGVLTRKNCHHPIYNGRAVSSKNQDGYLVARIDGHSHPVHRLIFAYMTGEWPAQVVDHINGDRTDNRWANLRDAPRAVNNQNRRTGIGASGLLGVTWSKKCGRWQAQIRAPGGGKIVWLGYFDTSDAASSAYILAKREMHEGCTL